MNWAVIGRGFISKRHVKAIGAIGHQVYVTCDTDPSKGADFTSVDALVKSNMYNMCQYVAVCTPNDTHYEILKKLGPEKTILCEKPVVLKYNQGLLLNDNVFGVLQLRYNPLLQELRRVVRQGGNNELDIIVKANRGPEYWQSWKGNPNQSGGILFNMGIHYIDVIQHLLGVPNEVVLKSYDKKYKAVGELRCRYGVGRFHIELSEGDGPIDRSIMLNGYEQPLEGATIPLSGDGFDLHTEVYKDLINGRGIDRDEYLPSIKLVEKIIKHA